MPQVWNMPGGVWYAPQVGDPGQAVQGYPNPAANPAPAEIPNWDPHLNDLNAVNAEQNVPPQAGVVAQNYVDKLYKVYMDATVAEKKAKTNRSTSRLSDEFRALASRTVKLKGLIDRERAEVERVLETISTQVEVVRDIGSTIQSHISSLQKDAILLETLMRKLPQSDLQQIEKELAEGHSAPAEVAPSAEVAAQQAELGLWQQDQG